MRFSQRLLARARDIQDVRHQVMAVPGADCRDQVVLLCETIEESFVDLARFLRDALPLCDAQEEPSDA